MNTKMGVPPVLEQIQGPRPKRAGQSALDATPERAVNFRLGAQHVLRRCPTGPFTFHLHCRRAAHAQTLAPDRNRVAARHAIFLDQIQQLGMDIDDDGSRPIRPVILDNRTLVQPGQVFHRNRWQSVLTILKHAVALDNLVCWHAANRFLLRRTGRNRRQQKRTKGEAHTRKWLS